MKFLCVPCDRPMTLQTVSPPEQGSLAVVYTCPDCGYEMAMLTNAYETQLVQSLGVRIGPADAAATPGRCPFTAMIPAQHSDRADSSGEPAEGTSPPVLLRWSAAAEARLLRVPEFVRPMARSGIEQYARDRGAREVDETILDAARDFFGM